MTAQSEKVVADPDLFHVEQTAPDAGEYFLGRKRVNTWEGGPKGDDNRGDLTSPAFTIEPGEDHLSFLLGGGKRMDGSLEVQLLVDGEVVRSETGPEAGALNWRSWVPSRVVRWTVSICRRSPGRTGV